MKKDTRVIYKYPIAAGGATVITGWFTKIVHVGEQNGELMLWMENSLTKPDFLTGEEKPRDEEEKIELQVWALGTGWKYKEGQLGTHIGTVQMSDGLVWHMFMKLPRLVQ